MSEARQNTDRILAYPVSVCSSTRKLCAPHRTAPHHTKIEATPHSWEKAGETGNAGQQKRKPKQPGHINPERHAVVSGFQSQGRRGDERRGGS